MAAKRSVRKFRARSFGAAITRCSLSLLLFEATKNEEGRLFICVSFKSQNEDDLICRVWRLSKAAGLLREITTDKDSARRAEGTCKV